MGWLTEFRELKSTTVTGRRTPVTPCKPAQGKRDPVTGSREVTSFLVTEFRHLEVHKVELRDWVLRGQYGPPKIDVLALFFAWENCFRGGKTVHEKSDP